MGFNDVKWLRWLCCKGANELKRRHDTQHNDTQHNDFQRYNK